MGERLQPPYPGVNVLSQFRLSFESPEFLTLLALVPAVWAFGWRRLQALGRWRRVAALGLRTAVIALVVLAMAETRMVRISPRLTVLFVLDQSDSVPPDARSAMARYVNQAVAGQRAEMDRAGVIVFGREPAIEVPPLDDAIQTPAPPESPVDGERTDVAAALRLAQGTFPEDSARRVVLVSDGNENRGDAAAQARSLAEQGIGIDVVPVHYRREGDVVVDRLVAPPEARQEQPVELRVVVTNHRQATADDPGVVRGRIVVRRGSGSQSAPVGQPLEVTLRPGKQVFVLRQQIDSVGFFPYEAVFEPERPGDDPVTQNNRAAAFTRVAGKGKVLLVLNRAEDAAAYRPLIQAMEAQKLEVAVRPSAQPFADLAELQQFDSVVLANVPRDRLSDGQVQMLVRNTHELGAGLVMLGGPESFGAGGWANTPIEDAMPLVFTIQANQVLPRGALAMIMHASEIPQGNYWQKKIAAEALKALGPRDYCGVIHYGGLSGTQWLWKPGMAVVGPMRAEMLARLDRMTPGDMPDFDPGLAMAAQALVNCEGAAVRHLIVISDGDPSPPSTEVVLRLIRAGITVSTVTVGAHGPAQSKVMRELAEDTGGQPYAVDDPKELPRIFQREARRASQPLIHENVDGFVPSLVFRPDMLEGVSSPLKPLTGYVMTTRKTSPLVEVPIVAPEPAEERYGSVVARWSFGAGRSVAITTDATARWSRAWIAGGDFDRLVAQPIRWSMRPSESSDQYTVATDIKDQQVRLVITAQDKAGEFLNFKRFRASAVGPDLQPAEVKIEQTGPGRYEGSFPADRAGVYLVAANPGPGEAPLRLGVSVPYSEEYRALQTNLPLLEQLAAVAPDEGEAGRLIDDADRFRRIDRLLETNVFRHDLKPATSRQDIWPLLALAASCLFFGDVFVRRVQVSFAWLPRLAARLFRKPLPPEPETLQRLRTRKAQIDAELEQRAGAAGAASPPSTGAPPPAAPAKAGSSSAPPRGEEDYTSRLLKAKQQAREKK